MCIGGLRIVQEWEGFFSETIKKECSARCTARAVHSEEHALPGHYSLGLPSIGVQADVAAAGTHAGVHEYAYQAHEGSCGLIFDACHNAAATASWCANATIALEADLAGTSLTVRASVRMAGTLSRRAANGSVPTYFHSTLTSLGDARLDV